MSTKILTAGTVITMDPARPRAEAVAVSDGRITGVGSVADCRSQYPDAEMIDTGVAALLPGLVEPHSHPVMSGVATQLPARSIAPWDAPTWSDVEAIFADAIAHTDPSTPLLFAGFDALLHQRPSPKGPELDRIFGDRVAVVTDNSGHGVYFNTAVMKRNGWDVNPPADPAGGHYGRNPDGTLDGQGFETPVLIGVAGPILAELGNPLVSAAEYYALMARGGYTSTSDMTYDPKLKTAYEALAAAPSCPLRISMWEMSTTGTYNNPESFSAAETLLVKQGVKLWTDGSPWIGNIAISFPYLSTDATRTAGIDPAVAGGPQSMNYNREQLDAILDVAAPAGWQMAFHANGDLAIELALDAYEGALQRHNLIGTDHRWRLEHLGAGTRRLFDRAAQLGVHVSMAPFQYYYWGDLLDGEMFDHEHGSQWAPFADAVASGAVVSLHNDGSVSPPTPVLNIQTAVTRRTRAGNVHGANQAITLDQALRAHTINAARTLHRDTLIGSLEVGKLADFTELAADPYAVDPTQLADQARVTGTWLSGERIDLTAFVGAVGRTDPGRHAHLAGQPRHTCC
ncbi:amidohydrolase [Mycobacterium sp. CVI_P3]|uniref:Amidohydrolase n=1 Tax=Mycobacterium pinniadriaticum TaxID=2994102 RepID=A0ABT3SIU7_9MYCO|nr:amidohydrolase [Mycobacterium pinniadriaticum]MCX2932649.1 amidohydrolase [Mycobacterium pinniadriaticum]MCX2939073.1 amidohydrolase [Mycobacterium pinniadriaticum]